MGELCVGLACAAPLEISAVRVQPRVFNPSRSESVDIFFHLSQPAGVTVQVFDSDYFLIATLEGNRPAFAGTNHTRWNGRDADGMVVPDEAYYFVIEARNEEGQDVSYDPALFSGGETLTIWAPQLDKEKGVIRYSLSKAARVRIRAGIHNGPLLKTLLDWAPRPAGGHECSWDGRDGSGGSMVWGQDRFVLSVWAFTLPDNSIITEGNPVGYLKYWSRAAEKDRMPLMAFRLATEQGQKAHLKAKEVLRKAVQGRGQQIDNDFLASRFMNRDPEFTLTLRGTDTSAEGADPIVDGATAEVEIRLTEETRALLSEQRYEYVLYVDYLLQTEVETGHSPYTWVLDTTGLRPGRHVLTVNVATLNGQVGTASTWIDVQNP